MCNQPWTSFSAPPSSPSSLPQTLPEGFTLTREGDESIVIDGISIPHYRIVCTSPAADAAPDLDIDSIMASITEVDVEHDEIDGCSISAFCEAW